MDKFECTICLEVGLKTFKCLGCDHLVCRGCAKQHLLQLYNPPRCMNTKCKTSWTNKFLCDVINRSWVNNTKSGLRGHLKKVSLDRERSKIHKTLLSQEFEQHKTKVKNEAELKICNGLKAQIMKELKVIDGSLENWEDEKTLDELLDGKVVLLKKLYRIRKDVVVLKLAIPLPPNKKKLNAFPCPGDECEGLVSDGKCVLCDSKVCSGCYEFELKGKDGEAGKEDSENSKHKCNPDSLKSIKEMEKNTKSCPRCAARIFKISGCDQMWCTVCNIAFSWNRGVIVTGRIHNPHAHEWFRNRGLQDVQDVPCGELIDFPEFPYRIYQKNEIFRIYQLIAEIDEKLAANRIDLNIFEIYRMDYLTKKINEKQWESKIFRLEKENEKKRLLIDILTTLRVLGIERFRDFKINFLGVISSDLSKGKKHSARVGMCLDFIKDIARIAKLVNAELKSGLESLGVKNVLRINYTMVWSDKFTG